MWPFTRLSHVVGRQVGVRYLVDHLITLCQMKILRKIASQCQLVMAQYFTTIPINIKLYWYLFTNSINIYYT